MNLGRKSVALKIKFEYFSVDGVGSVTWHETTG